jgi:hypothetical protein
MPLTVSMALAMIPLPSALVPRFAAVERGRLADDRFPELVAALDLADDFVDPLAEVFVFDPVGPPVFLAFVEDLDEADALADFDADDLAFVSEDFDYETEDFEAPDLDPEVLVEVVLLPEAFDEADREVEDFFVAGILFPPLFEHFLNGRSPILQSTYQSQLAAFGSLADEVRFESLRAADTTRIV